MNFKESYKKANDEITGDIKLLEKILASPKREKPKIIPIIYKTASLTAAFILIITVALMPGIKDKFEVNETAAPETVALETEEAVTEESVGALNDSAEAYDGVVKFSLRRTEEKKAVENTKTKSVSAEISAISDLAVVNETNDEILAYSAEDVEAPEAAYDSSEKDIELTHEAGVQAFTEQSEKEVLPAEVRASGGGSSAVIKSAGPKKKTYTAREALSQIGISYESLVLNGMALSEEAVFADFSLEGKLLAYDINITLSDGDKVMTVFLTESVTPLAYDVTEADGKITASKTVGNTDVFITAQNITKEEIEIYLNSIA